MTDSRSTPAARLDGLTRLYERHAYVVWNVALRTTLDEVAAGSASRRVFVAHLESRAEERLPLEVAGLAVDVAGGVDARGVEHPVLAATAHLAAVQRAVLALGELTDVRPAEVAEKLGIDPQLERQLRDRAYEQLGVLLGVTRSEAQSAYEEVPWIEPPSELWQALYPELHEAVTRHAQAATKPAAAVPTDASDVPTRGRHGLRGAAVAAVAALAVAGVAWAATGGDGGSAPGSSDVATQDYAGLPSSVGDGSSSAEDAQDEGDDSASSLLTPEELDRLRRKEIEKLKRFERRKDDRRLPDQERDRAARKVGDLVKLARARQRAAEQRELELRRQLAREREARLRERDRHKHQPDDDSAPSSQEQPAQDHDDRDGQRTEEPKSGGGRDRDQVETECLYDPNNGTYVCPE